MLVIRTDGNIELRNVISGEIERFSIPVPQGQRIQVRAISKDGSTIAISTGNRRESIPGEFAVWRRMGENFEQVRGIPVDKPVTVAALNRDGSRMITGVNQLLEVWQLNDDGAFNGRAINRVSVSLALAMSDDGDRFLVGSAEGTLQAWQFSGKPLTRQLKLSGPVIATAFSNDGRLAAAASATLDDSGTARVQVWTSAVNNHWLLQHIS